MTTLAELLARREYDDSTDSPSIWEYQHSDFFWPDTRTSSRGVPAPFLPSDEVPNVGRILPTPMQRRAPVDQFDAWAQYRELEALHDAQQRAFDRMRAEDLARRRPLREQLPKNHPMSTPNVERSEAEIDEAFAPIANALMRRIPMR